ncbi:DUF6374 family protein [Nocardia sp. R16R-3T]
MPLSRLDWARMNLEQVRTQLLEAATFGKYLPPEQLENAAGKIAEGMRIYAEETPGAPADRSLSDTYSPRASA